MPVPSKLRIDWVDYAKGICIVLVVMMHSTLGVEKAVGETSWLHLFIDWARPFRMPDFFLISGLFLASRIDRPWRSYLDTKVLHFGYFYVLWMTIQFAVKSPDMVARDGISSALQGYLTGFVQPFGTLWFIYMLAVFFVVAKLARPVPPLAMFLAGAALEILPIETGSLLIDEFASRFVYFYTGYWMASRIFGFAAAIGRRPWPTIVAGLFMWGAINALLVNSGAAVLPGVSLVLGFIGAGAVISTGVLLSKFRIAGAIRYCGVNSIIVYLAFFLFMAGSRAALLRSGIISEVGLVSLIVTGSGVIGSLMLFWATRGTRLSFLFRRPDWARLAAEPQSKFPASESAGMLAG